MRAAFAIVVLLVAMLALGVTRSDSRAAEAGSACVHRPAPAGAVGKRVAIIVGDGAYKNGIPALPNPSHDADAVSKAVAALGFEIFLSTDADSAALQKCLDKAYADLAGIDVAMLYYSGHGIQIQDANYLVATDAGAGDLKNGFVPVQPIVDVLQRQAKATLVLLDACRDNPWTGGGTHGLSVSLGRGLARVKDPAVPANAPVVGTPGVVQAHGLMVAYATSPNAVALDGTGHLSPFTGPFVKTVGISGYSIQRVMSDVNKDVGETTDWRQTPWMKSSLTGELKLGGGETLADAQSISDNHAARSAAILNSDGKREPAIIEALKGLPASPDAAALERFSKAYVALYKAVQSREIVLPLSPGMTEAAVSTQNRAAIYRSSADYQSGTFDLWSVNDQRIVTKPDVGRRGGSETFTFSPHGKLLGVGMGNATGVFDGIDGTRMFEVRGRASSLEFSPDERRLLLADQNASQITIVDVATPKSTMVIKKDQLDPNPKKGRSVFLSKTTFGGNDTVCYTLQSEYGNDCILGVYDLKEHKPARLREVDNANNILMCDPAGKYLVRTLSLDGTGQGMEIWDLAADRVSLVHKPIVNLMGIQPAGNYVSVLAADDKAQGFYELATGKMGYPPTVPYGYWILGSVVRNASGGLVTQDITPNAWRDWPDETLSGPALVKHALAGLTDAQRVAIARERITFATVAGNP